MTDDPNSGSPDGRSGEPADVQPEIFVDGERAHRAGWSGDRPPPHPGTRRWAAVGIAVVLVFFIGVAVGNHFGDDQSATTGPTTRSGQAPSGDTKSVSPSPAESLWSSQAATPTVTTGSDAPTVPAQTGPGPFTTTLSGGGSVPLPDSSGWQLVGFQQSGHVIRYEPATQELTSTDVPWGQGDGPLSVVFTGNALVVRPWDFVAGYLVVDGSRAVQLSGALATGTLVLPGRDANHVWALAEDRGSLKEVDANGKPTGTAIPIPDKLQIPAWALTPDGAGYVLGAGLEGTYDLRPDGAQLVTHGLVRAAGPTGYLIEDCGNADSGSRCRLAVLGRGTTTIAPVPGSGAPPQGVISPDGNYAAIGNRGSQSVTLPDLTAGRSITISGDGVGSFGTAQASKVAFSPDSRYLLVATAEGVVPIDTYSMTARDALPIPGLYAVATRPTG